MRQAGVWPALRRAWPFLTLLFGCGAVGGLVWALAQPQSAAALLRLQGPALWAAMAGLLGLCAVLAGMLLVALLAPRRVKAPLAEKVADSFYGSVLAVTPALTPRDLRQIAPDLRDPGGLVVSAPQSLFAQCARTVATRMARWRAGEGGMSVAFISAAPREGASAMALAVGRSLALAGRRVALIDADVRDRTASQVLELTSGRGLWTLMDALAAGDVASVDAHMAPDQYTGLWILAQSDGWAPTREVYGHGQFRAVLDALKLRYDHVLVDCGPVGLVDGRMTAVQADAAIIVTRWDGTLARHLSIAQRGLQELGGVLPGVIVNGASEGAVRRWLSKTDHHAAP